MGEHFELESLVFLLSKMLLLKKELLKILEWN